MDNNLNYIAPGKQPIEIKTDSEIEIMRQAGHAVAVILQKLATTAKAGMTTKYLDDLAKKEISSFNMKPAFLGYHGYPATACISINNELVHGIPSPKKIIKEGDLVSIDLGVLHNGFYGDMAVSFGIGRVSPEAEKLLEVTKVSLDKAISKVNPQNRLGDVSWAVQSFAEKAGFSVVRDYVGHGIGRKLHEEPQIPNFGQANTGVRLLPGMVLCLEPMVNTGSYEVKTLDDNWTVVTVDGKLCAHFEHMVAVTKNGYEVLTAV